MQAQGPETQRSLKKLKRENWKQILLVSGLTRQEKENEIEGGNKTQVGENIKTVKRNRLVKLGKTPSQKTRRLKRTRKSLVLVKRKSYGEEESRTCLSEGSGATTAPAALASTATKTQHLPVGERERASLWSLSWLRHK